jgi:hypothetical protein
VIPLSGCFTKSEACEHNVHCDNQQIHASVLALTNSNGQLWIWLAFESVATSGNLIEETTYS